MMIIFTPPDFTLNNYLDSDTHAKLSDSIVSAAFYERHDRIPSGWINKLYKSKDNQVLIYEIVFESETEPCGHSPNDDTKPESESLVKNDDCSIIAANTQFIPVLQKSKSNTEILISSQPDSKYIHTLYSELNLIPISTLITEHGNYSLNELVNIFGVIFDLDGVHSFTPHSLGPESDKTEGSLQNDSSATTTIIKYSIIYMYDFDLKLRVQVKLWRHFSKWIESFSKGSRVQIRNLKVFPIKNPNASAAFELSTTSSTELFLLGDPEKRKNVTLSHSRLSRLSRKEQEILSFLNDQSLLLSSSNSNSKSYSIMLTRSNPSGSTCSSNLTLIPLNIEKNSSNSKSSLWKVSGVSSMSSPYMEVSWIEFQFFNAVIWSKFCTLLHHNDPKSLSSYMINFKNLTQSKSQSQTQTQSNLYIFTAESSLDLIQNFTPYNLNNPFNNDSIILNSFNWNHFLDSKVILFGFYKVTNCFISTVEENSFHNCSSYSFTKFTCNSLAPLSAQTRFYLTSSASVSANENFSFLIENNLSFDDNDKVQKIRNQNSFILFIKSELNEDNFEEITHKTMRIVLL